LTLDAPRIVIGRGDGCEIRLPDPSVSHRHASIRRREADHLLVDEGSTNGTFLGRRRLAPHTPEALRAGDLVRVGRVWLRVTFDPAAAVSKPGAAKEFALELVAHALAAQGEDPAPRVTITEGAGQGRALRLDEPGRPYVIGRAKDVDLVLESAAVARRHATVTRRGDGFLARDLGSPSGTLLNGAPLPQTDTAWRPGQILTVAGVRLSCEHPAAEALAELSLCPDEPIRPGEVLDPPDLPESEQAKDPGAREAPTPPPPSADMTPAPPTSGRTPDAPRGWGLTDAVVVLLALGVLALSIVGLLLLLGRG
jgi:pSer/pThr/pTyr-binding forkhead associated (FHA) protein